MKKIYFAALAMALTACVSNEDLNPVDNYGYIDVNVSNDPVMVTKAVQTVTNLTEWTMSATATQGEANYQLPSSVPPGTYTVVANCKSHTDIQTACNVGITDETGTYYYGEAYYEGNYNASHVVSTGTTTSITIPCSTAKNSRVKLVNSLSSELFSNVSIAIEAITNDSKEVRKPVNLIGAENKNIAYYVPNAKLNYTINYTFGGENKEKRIGDFAIGGAGTESVITLLSNTNGQITVSVSYDDTFGDGNDRNITFDAATGEKVSDTPANNS